MQIVSLGKFIESSSRPGSQYHINLKDFTSVLTHILQPGTILLNIYTGSACDLLMVHVLAAMCGSNTQEKSTKFPFQTFFLTLSYQSHQEENDKVTLGNNHSDK